MTRVARNLSTTLLSVLAAVALLAGCGSGTHSGNPNPPTGAAPVANSVAAGPSGGGQGGPCSPTGTTVTVSAKNLAFDAKCLAAPANKPFTISFDNKDSGVPHNVAIFTDSSASKALFTGSVVTGPKTVTYQVPALKAGTYYFRCDVHPTTMHGTFVVK